jgi:hypothetical protein
MPCAGLGVANLAAGFFQGFPISSSSSRTPVAVAAGARIQLTVVVGALVVALLLIVALDLLLQNLPTSALVIASAIGLFEFADLRRIYLIRHWGVRPAAPTQQTGPPAPAAARWLRRQAPWAGTTTAELECSVCVSVALHVNPWLSQAHGRAGRSSVPRWSAPPRLRRHCPPPRCRGRHAGWHRRRA